MSKHKTREEKKQSSYRLQNFKINMVEVQNRKDVQEFGYLSKEFVRKDLLKTVIYSTIIVVLLLTARKYLS